MINSILLFSGFFLAVLLKCYEWELASKNNFEILPFTLRLSVSLFYCLWWLGDNVVDDYDRLDQTFFLRHRNRIIALKIVDGFWMEFLMTASSLVPAITFFHDGLDFFSGKTHQTNKHLWINAQNVFFFVGHCSHLLQTDQWFFNSSWQISNTKWPSSLCLCKQHQLPTLSQLLVDNFWARKNKKSLKSSIMS